MSEQNERPLRPPPEETTTARRRLWRAVSAAPLPLLVVIYALWTDLVVLDTSGFHIVWGLGDFFEWVTMSVGTAVLVAALWMPLRPVRMLAMAIYSLALAFGCGAAGVVEKAPRAWASSHGARARWAAV